jgi:hypothetical protein
MEHAKVLLWEYFTSYKLSGNWMIMTRMSQHTPSFEIMSQPYTSPSPEPLLDDVQDIQSSSYQPSAVSDSARQERLAALERRLGKSATGTQSSSTPDVAQDPQPFDANHAKRTEFRRLVDPGIVRPNSKEVALRALCVNLKTCSFASGLNDIFLSCLKSYFHRRTRRFRPCLQSLRTCFASLTIPSSVSSKRRIRLSRMISWTPRAR